MKKSTRIAKRLLALFLVVLMSINTLGAVVSDNDGSAFITKAEFDSLKNDFQSQIDQYNTSIDSKIDGAIASYLAGVQVSRTTNMMLDEKCGYTFPLVKFDNSSRWNDVQSDYYNVGAPELHSMSVVYRHAARFADSATITGAKLWNPQTMQPDGIASGCALPGTTATLPPDAGWNLLGTTMVVKVFDIKGKDTDMALIKPTSESRKVGATNQHIFDIDTKGLGHQIFYYKTNITTATSWPDGAKSTSGYNWVGYAFCGTSSIGRPTGSTVFVPNAGNWATDSFRVNGVHQGLSDAAYFAWGSGETTDTIISNLNYFTGGYNTMNEYISNNELQTNVVNWETTSGNHNVYARNATVYAEVKSYCGYTGDYTKGANANIYNDGRLETGENYGSVFNYSTTAKTYPLYQFRYVLYHPDFKAKTYNNSTDGRHVSAYNAYNIRYYDSNKVAHFLDEGMYLGTFDQESVVSFKLKFGTRGSTKNVRLYVSKYPFSYENGLTKLAEFKLDDDATKVDNALVQTGTTVKIEVDDVQKGE